jgi:prophage antirepressor-like protein
VRVVTIEDNPWFVALDVCEVLGLGNPSSSLALLESDEVRLHTMEGNAGPRDFNIINEPGLYSLVLRSRKPQAKAFKRWVTHEVLPSIRKTGQYSVAPVPAIPATYAEALRAAAEMAELAERERVENLRKAEIIREMAPKADFADAVSSAINAHTIDQAAKILGIGEKKLFAYLREQGYLRKNNEPYQKYIDNGLFRLREKKFNLATGEVQIYTQTLMTGKGMIYFQKRLFGKNLDLAALPQAANA